MDADIVSPGLEMIQLPEGKRFPAGKHFRRRIRLAMPAATRPPHDKYAPSAVKRTMSKNTMNAELNNPSATVHPRWCAWYPEMIPVSEKPRKSPSKTMDIPLAVEKEIPRISSAFATSQISRHNGATTNSPMIPILSRCLLGDIKRSALACPLLTLPRAGNLAAAKPRRQKHNGQYSHNHGATKNFCQANAPCR
jgi:hypothetical protein